MVTDWQYEEQRQRLGLEPSTRAESVAFEEGEKKETEGSYFVSHAVYCERAVNIDPLQIVVALLIRGGSGLQHKDWSKQFDNHLKEVEQERQVEAYAERILDLALDLEAQARKLLVDNLPQGGMERLLLRADLNLQRRDAKACKYMILTGISAWIYLKWRILVMSERANDPDEVKAEMLEQSKKDEERMGAVLRQDEDTFDQVRRYRETFAHLLAAGSRFRGLEGTCDMSPI